MVKCRLYDKLQALCQVIRFNENSWRIKKSKFNFDSIPRRLSDVWYRKSKASVESSRKIFKATKFCAVANDQNGTDSTFYKTACYVVTAADVNFCQKLNVNETCSHN